MMNTNTMELNMEDLELVNGGSDWMDHLAGAAGGMAMGASAGFVAGMAGGPVGIVTGVIGGGTFGAVVGGAMGCDVLKQKIHDIKDVLSNIF